MFTQESDSFYKLGQVLQPRWDYTAIQRKSSFPVDRWQIYNCIRSQASLVAGVSFTFVSTGTVRTLEKKKSNIPVNKYLFCLISHVAQWMQYFIFPVHLKLNRILYTKKRNWLLRQIQFTITLSLKSSLRLRKTIFEIDTNHLEKI